MGALKLAVETIINHLHGPNQRGTAIWSRAIHGIDGDGKLPSSTYTKRVGDDATQEPLHPTR